jgi:outer membrane protein OmpA-like peptidoglycan-associated protein
MNMKKTVSVLLFIVLLLNISSLLYSEALYFKYSKGSKYRVLGKVVEKVYVDGKFSHDSEILNKAAIEHTDVEGTRGLVSALYQVSEKVQSSDQMHHLDEEHKVSYWIDKQGRYEVNQNDLYPLSRNIPFFPDKELSPGDEWEATGMEVYDFRPFMIQMPIHVPVTVHYTYVKNETREGTLVARLHLKYEVHRELKELRFIPGRHPLLIYGRVEQNFFWDIEKGRPHSYEDSFDIFYIFNDNQMYEFIGTSRAQVFESPEMDRERMKKEIEKSIQEEKIEDTSVTADDAGVTIVLENIHFSPESDILLPAEQLKLKKIAGILKQYPDRDLLIAGHTALAGTEEGRQILSDKRAKAVGEFLKLHGLTNSMVYKGYGALFPVAENSTEEGMKKNRRVEIKILEN